ncbi:hypothetical protein [Celeribacter litoreus]|uniref:hypothetical protein n=1 Tax=Celeribacter litoreus TaxID=2876714 RepID=UPI001CCBE553|nr:hypothetical protein [Celeribacter litoreus]MCA0044121.1 hypothetical protein [Celeribacter litoreus]
MQALKASILALFIAVPTVASAAETVNPRNVDERFAIHRLHWSPSGETFIRWSAYNHDGYIAICGAYTVSKGSRTLTFTKRALLASRIKLNGKTVITNLSYFNDVPNQHLANELVGQSANCKVTTTPSSAAADGTFEYELDKDTFRM